MKKKVYFDLRICEDVPFVSIVKDAITTAADAAVVGGAGFGGTNPQIIGAEFAERLANEIYAEFFDYYAAEKFVFAREFDEERTKANGGKIYVLSGLKNLVNTWAKRYVKREIIGAWWYIKNVYEIGENGKTTTSTETDATGTSTQTSNGATAQRFNSGISTSSSGVANKTETNETANGQTTGKTKQQTTQGYAYEFAGKPDEFVNANMAGASVLQKLVGAFSLILLPVDDVEFEELGNMDEIGG